MKEQQKQSQNMPPLCHDVKSKSIFTTFFVCSSPTYTISKTLFGTHVRTCVFCLVYGLKSDKAFRLVAIRE